MSNGQNFYTEDGFFNAYPNQQQQYYGGNQTQQSPFYDSTAFYNPSQAQPQYYNPLQGQTPYQPNEFFIPATQNTSEDQLQAGATNFEQEPPLLEELGINFEHIYRKTVCVLNPFAKPCCGIC